MAKNKEVDEHLAAVFTNLSEPDCPPKVETEVMTTMSYFNVLNDFVEVFVLGFMSAQSEMISAVLSDDSDEK